jgi:catalase
VHAKGAGARGYFEVTSDIAQFTSANFLSSVGKKTDLRVRFSTVAGGRGSADTVRDTRGFAFKLYTDEGNLDWLFFSEPVFPIRDGAKFPSFVHCQKGVPSNNLFDSSTFWEFMNANSEAYHALLMIFSDRGTPQGYQYSEIFGLNTYKFTKDAVCRSLLTQVSVLTVVGNLLLCEDTLETKRWRQEFHKRTSHRNSRAGPRLHEPLPLASYRRRKEVRELPRVGSLCTDYQTGCSRKIPSQHIRPHQGFTSDRLPSHTVWKNCPQ